MTTIKPRVEIAVRVFLIAAVLLNALAPTLSASAGSPKEQIGKRSSPLTTSPLPPTIKYDPPAIKRPTRFDPMPDEPAPVVPSKGKLEFVVTSDTSVLDASGQIALQVFIRNHTDQEIGDLVFTDPLEQGLDFISGDANSPALDSKKHNLTLSIPKLIAGEEFAFTYILSVNSAKRAGLSGKLWLHVVQLDSNPGNFHLTASALFGEGSKAGRPSMATFKPNGGWNALGRFSIYMTRDTIDPDSALVATPVSVPGNGPAFQFKLDVVKTNKLNKDNQGKPVAQTVILGDASNAVFKRPAFLEINLKGIADLND